MKVSHSAIILAGIGVHCVVSAVLAANVATQEPAEPKEEAAFPQFPSVNLANPKNIDAADPDRMWEDRVRKLVERSKSADQPRKRAENVLAAANFVLGRQLEPYCTRRLVGIPGNDSDKASLNALFDRFDQLVGDSRKAIAEDPDSEPRLAHFADVLETMGTAQKAFLLNLPPDNRRQAASALARFLEDSDKRIAECARLWQVLLRTTEDDPSFALQVLDNPMVPPSPGSWPYGLFSKVLRCRFQAIDGRWSSAMVMLSHIEEQLELWVPDVAHRGDARRFFAYMRFETLKRWHDALLPDMTAERAWCRAEAEDVVREYFSVDTSILRLDPAVPDLFPEEVLEADGLEEPGHDKK